MGYDITLTQLRYLVALDKHQHFGKAADACHVSQPTLSIQIQKLEEHLGVTLFDRSVKPIQATDIGREVLRQARLTLREADSITAVVQQAQGEFKGTLKLGILPTLAPYIIPLMTKSFGEAYPEVRIHVQELTTPYILQGLEQDELDAGVIATDEADKMLIETRLFDEAFVNYVSPQHRLSQAPQILAEKLDLNEIWLLNEGHCFRDQVLNLCQATPDLSPENRGLYFDCGYFDTLIRMVETVGGTHLVARTIAIVSDRATKKAHTAVCWTNSCANSSARSAKSIFETPFNWSLCVGFVGICPAVCAVHS